MPLTKVRNQGLSFTSGVRNLIINGAMQVAQRGTSTSSVASGGYYASDRWRIDYASAGTWTVSQSTTSPTGFSNSFKMDCTTADASLSAGDALIFNQRIEGQNLQHLKKGTSDAESVTLSFWVRSNKTGTYIAELIDNDNTRGYSQSYTISSANTWEHKTLTYSGDTTGALGNDNGLSLYVNFWLAAGTDFTSGTLATSWEAQTSANRAVGQVNLADSTSNEWYITGVQLEVGDSASNFEHRSYGDELQRCQRYFYRHDFGGNLAPAMHGGSSNGSQGFFDIQLPVTMRTAPSTSDSSPTFVTSNVDANEIGIYKNGFQTVSGSFGGRSGPNHINFSYTTAGLSAGDAVTLDTGEDYYVQGDAEL